MRSDKQKGFTLIELLVVISIIGLLSSVVMSSLSQARKKAQGTNFVAQMNQLKTAFELYRNDKSMYPFENNDIYLDDISYIKLVGDIINNRGFNNELVDNRYISSISNISKCVGGCFSGGPEGEDYGYLSGINASAVYTCGGQIFKNYLFYVGNNQIDINYPQLDDWPGYYCIGQ